MKITNEQQQFWDDLRLPTKRDCFNCKHAKSRKLWDVECEKLMDCFRSSLHGLWEWNGK